VPGLIRRDDIDEVRSRTNIADVVGDHVTLKGAGVGSLKGLCPFHDERSPSFGCGEDGDVYSFVMKTDHTTFQEAVERLASRIGFTLRYEDGGKASDHGGRARLIAANEAAREFFAQHLTAADADPARRFLGERGFDPAAAERFGVGFAPKSFDALRSHLKGAGFADEELVTAGLLSQGDRSPYDRFRGRLVWPIRDVTGSTIGFGARRLLDDDKGPKYLNTPETPIYHKSQVLYGLDLARRDIAKGKQVVIVEGYTDVMACHLAGVTTAVATCGTSFGVDHIKLLRPMLGESAGHDLSALGQVVFTFDPDEAGQKAASRAFAEEQRFQTQTFVALPPEGLDPCDLRLARGDDAVRRMIDTRRPMFEFMIQRSVVGFDLETVEGRASAVRAAAPAVASIRDNSIRLGYARFLAKAVGEDTESVVEVVTSVMRQAQAVAAAPRALPANASEGRQSITSLPPLPDEPAGPSLMTLPGDLTTRTERDAVMAMLQHPDAVGFELMRRAVQARLETTSLAVVRDAIGASLDKFGDASWLDVVLDQTPAPFDALAKELAVAPIPERQDREITTYCRGIVVSIVERDLIREKSELMGRSFRTDVKTDPDKWREIQVQLAALEVERRALTAEQ
jgi:DNA primase